jgi:hypothetical protein
MNDAAHSTLTEELNLAQLLRAGVDVSLLFFPCFKGRLHVFVGLDTDVIVFVQILQLYLTGGERHACRPLQFRIYTIFERLEADSSAHD